MNIWNRLPCSAVSHVMILSVDNFHKLAMPAIRVMQPLYGAALIKFHIKGMFFWFFLYLL